MSRHLPTFPVGANKLANCRGLAHHLCMNMHHSFLGPLGCVAVAFLLAVGFASGGGEETPAVSEEAYFDLMANEILDVQDLAEGAEIQRRFFNRITPPGLSWVQPMFPEVAPFDSANFDDKFLEDLLGADKNSVAVYPLSLVLDPKTRETLVLNAEGKIIALVPSDGISRTWPEDADPGRITLKLDLLPAEDAEQYLYTEGRIAETLAAYSAKSTKSPRTDGISLKSLTPGQFGIANVQHLTNGNFRLTVTNGGAVAEVYSYTVWHTSSVEVITWTNEESNVITSTNIIWTPTVPSFNGLESEWIYRETNLVLTNGVGVWEDSNVSSNDRVRFYAVANWSDADEDELTGGSEIFLYCTDPNNADSDGDDLFDGLEVNEHYTDPNNSDTDADGMPDGWEIQNGLDPHDDGTTNAVNGAEGDLDGDGFNNILEYELGAPANNPAWNGAELAYRLTHAHPATGSRSTTTNLIGMRVEIEDSENCGGANDERQIEVDTLYVPDMLAWGYFIDITVDGAVEDKDDYYDQVHVRAFTNTYYFEGNDNQNGCNMANKSVTRNVLILENSSVELEYDTMSYMYHVGGYAEITAAAETGYIESETVALYPINRARTEVGVAEEVAIKIYPDPGGVTWSVSGGGLLTETSGAETRFIAPSNASTCPITINFSGHSITKNFGVLEPVGVVEATISSRAGYPIGEAGAGMWLAPVVIGPTNVSFYQVEMTEVGQNATNCIGYFLWVNPPPPHIPRDWVPLNPGNQWADEASIREPHVAPPWSDGGRFEWPIPAQWRIGATGETNTMPGWNQVIDLDADGTVTVHKFGKWVERTVNNAITNN